MIPTKVLNIISDKIFADNLNDFSYIVCWDWTFSPRVKTRRATELLVHLRVKTHERSLKHTSLWLGIKTKRFSGTNQIPERLQPSGTSLIRQCPQGLFRPDLKSTHSPWVSEDEALWDWFDDKAVHVRCFENWTKWKKMKLWWSKLDISRIVRNISQFAII